MDEYDDFLGLHKIDFRRSQLIVLGGISGSGKSTAMEFLRCKHPHFQGQPSLVIRSTRLGLKPVSACGQLVLLDEVNSLRELRFVSGLLRTNRVIVATHLPLACYLPFKAIKSTRLFRTDRRSNKIARYLQKREIRFTAPTLRHYCRTYGANYLDVAHILERFPSEDFDRSYARFQKQCQIRRTAWETY